MYCKRHLSDTLHPRTGTTIATGPHSMSPDIDLEVGQLMIGEEEVGRSETHEMATVQPHNSTVASVPSPVLTGQDFDHKEQPVVSQADSEAR